MEVTNGLESSKYVELENFLSNTKDKNFWVHAYGENLDIYQMQMVIPEKLKQPTKQVFTITFDLSGLSPEQEDKANFVASQLLTQLTCQSTHPIDKLLSIIKSNNLANTYKLKELVMYLLSEGVSCIVHLNGISGDYGALLNTLRTITQESQREEMEGKIQIITTHPEDGLSTASHDGKNSINNIGGEMYESSF